MRYPKRLIEVDLPIKEISAHARREKSIRHGHISTLHMWWARRPLAACRAVICATLWPDPADPDCPQSFRNAAAASMVDFGLLIGKSKEVTELCGAHQVDWIKIAKGGLGSTTPAECNGIRDALLMFIADFSDWDASTVPVFLETARRLTTYAFEALGGASRSQPVVVDPFAGGGAIPLEALRVGASPFASDLNPVAVILNTVQLEFAPRFGPDLPRTVHDVAAKLRAEAWRELGAFYKTQGNETPSAYFWARTLISEAPSSADEPPVEVPLLKSMWLKKSSKNGFAFRWVRDSRGEIVTDEVVTAYADGTSKKVLRPRIEIFSPSSSSEVEPAPSKGGTATCPVTGYTMSVERVRSQLAARKGGTRDARMVCVSAMTPTGRIYRSPTARDMDVASLAVRSLEKAVHDYAGPEPLLPDGELNHLRGFFNVVLYGMGKWGDIFPSRQALALTTFSRLVRELGPESVGGDQTLLLAVKTSLALVVNRLADKLSSLARWDSSRENPQGTFGRQALPMVWDFCEPNPFSGAGGDWDTAVDWVVRVLDHIGSSVPRSTGQVVQASATQHPLPDDCADAVVTDPPYYAAVPYADLSDFFYSWLRRSLHGLHGNLLVPTLVPKDRELVSLAHRAAMYRHKDAAWFEHEMGLACGDARRVCKPEGLGVFVFASKDTPAWEAMLAALIASGWVVTASWPIDTEMGSRLRARNSATLASSIHIVCRPRENPDGTLRTDDVGDWRDVLAELPTRIHEWMPRLAKEGVVGADAIFACLGPALEVFSRYARVEKASGEAVTLREYLEHVWAAVAREALSMIFEGAEASGFEEDARLTAMWLWTLSTVGQDDAGSGGDDEEDSDEDDGDSPKKKPAGGFSLEFDAARKIAQGLGAHLEDLDHVIEVKGSTARLRSVNERTRYLFGKDQADAPTIRKARKQADPELFAEFDREQIEGTWGEKVAPKPGATTLDRVHQAMILFAAGRTEALRRFVVEEGVGHDQLFWRLAQALSALYPGGAEEKRWVDGLLARKRSLGFG